MQAPKSPRLSTRYCAQGGCCIGSLWLHRKAHPQVSASPLCAAAGLQDHQIPRVMRRDAVRPSAAKRGLAYARRARNFVALHGPAHAVPCFVMKQALHGPAFRNFVALHGPATNWCSRLAGCIPTAQWRASDFPVLLGGQPADLTTDRYKDLRKHKGRWARRCSREAAR